MSRANSEAINRLTAAQVVNAKPQEGKKEINLNDGGGLYLVATDTRKRWQYQFSLFGTKGKMWLGEFPKVSLAAARKLRNTAHQTIEAGKDPRIEKQAAKIAAKQSQENTFEAIAREWHSKELESEAWIPSHAARIIKRLQADIFPCIGKRSIDSLETQDLLYPLSLVTKRGHYNLAKAYRQYITVIMRFAIQTGRIKVNPALDLQGAIPTRKTKNRPALALTDTPTLLARIAEHKGMAVIRLATRFALLTGARSSEFRFAQWGEFDLAAGVWTIPEEREAVEGVLNSERGEKMRRERVIYLSTQAVAVVKELQVINGRAAFVFQGRKYGTPISENTINHAMRGMGYDTEQEVCLHGFRTMMVSGLRESAQFSFDAIERHIGHEGGGNKVALIYGRNAQYLTERQRMLQWWADYLDALQDTGYIHPADFGRTGNVIQLPIKAA